MSGRLLNVMYSAGADFVSIHKVHGRIAKVLQEDFPEVSHWFLQGDDRDLVGHSLDSPVFLQLSVRQIKGSGLALLFRYAVRQRVRKMLDDLQPDAILIDGLRAARLILPLIRERLGSSTRIAVVLHSLVRITKSDVDLLRSVPPDRLQVVAVSPDAARQMLQKHPLLQGWLVGIASANDPVERCLDLSNRQAKRAGLGVGEGDLVLGAVGRLNKVKNFQFLVRCFSAVGRDNPRAHLVILGEGEQRAELEQCIRELGVERQVHLVGFREDAMSLYGAFDWLVCPSLYEGFGLVIGESLMAGVPVIVSDLGVFREQLGDAGRYAQVNDAQAWQRELAGALELDADQREQIYAAQVQAFDFDGRWKAFAEAYRLCMGAR